MREIRIPALTALSTQDATAVRSIVSVLLEEIQRLDRDVESLKKTRDDVYRNRMSRRGS